MICSHQVEHIAIDQRCTSGSNLELNQLDRMTVRDDGVEYCCPPYRKPPIGRAGPTVFSIYCRQSSRYRWPASAALSPSSGRVDKQSEISMVSRRQVVFI